jgi:hypothetical protein
MSRTARISVAAATLLLACRLVAGCGGDGGSNDAAVDPGTDVSDARSEMCIAHPNTCNTGGGVIEAYDCCSQPRVCCDLCFPAGECGSRTECLERCPRTIPCEGLPDASAVSCYFDPDDFAAAAYCPMNLAPNPSTPTACAADCPTGVECPLPRERYGNSALCCPASSTCETVPLYELPRCVAP